MRRWFYKWLNNRKNIGPHDLAPTCQVPGCSEPAVDCWFPSTCALREAGVEVDWVSVCAEHDVQSNEETTRFFFGAKYDAELAAYRSRRINQ